MVTKLYNGEVLLEFDEKRHVYRVNGDIVPGVTGIVGVLDKSGPLLGWGVKLCAEYWKEHVKPGESYDELQLNELYVESKRQHRKKKGTAANIGTMGHEWAEKYALAVLNGTDKPEVPVSKTLQNICLGFQEWWETHDVEPIEAEFKVYSRLHGYAGTCDLDALVDGKRSIVDYKTGSGVYKEVGMQMAAYQSARYEERGIEYDQRLVVHLDKTNGNVEQHDFPDYDKDVLGFLSALGLFKWTKT